MAQLAHHGMALLPWHSLDKISLVQLSTPVPVASAPKPAPRACVLPPFSQHLCPVPVPPKARADRKIDSIRTAGCERSSAAAQRSHSRKEETEKKGFPQSHSSCSPTTTRLTE
ncbi:hypothetical protein DV515_00015604 [Chloebia gouldiae]|uniref:Uncharacterized protein n=1 Tax=Chloebia gouldiae TaxID=44316 RepID=A0A3L8RWB1_CHLGU|nr:hypothetical protein DV515_00015604 [Chloebia gouldiae]